MNGKHSSRLAVCAFAVIPTVAIAQERIATSGRVLGADGQPVANATVHFVGSEASLRDRFAPADAPTATTNDKGRFQVELLGCAEYECWVVAPASADGTHACSEVRDVRPGTGFEVTLTATTRARQLTIGGFEPWQGVAALRCEVAPALAHCRPTPVAPGAREVTLPPVPPGTAWHLFVRDADGGLFWCERVDPATVACEFVMPPPRTVPVRVVDANQKPIAGATIRVWSNGPWRNERGAMTPSPQLGDWRLAGTSDAAGNARVVAPGRSDPFEDDRAAGPVLLVGKRDHTSVLGGWHNQLVGVTAAAPASERQTELTFTLAAGSSWHGRIVGSDGKPLADTVVALSGQCTMPLASGAWLGSPTRITTRTGADGTFHFDALPSLPTPTLHVQGLTATVPGPALLRPDLRRPLELDARRLVPLELTVREVDGGPARGAEVVLLPSPIGKSELDDAAWRSRLDNRGRVQILVQPGTWHVFVCNRRGFACAMTTCADANALTLTMTALPVMRGAIDLAADERPADVQLFVNGIRHDRADPAEPVAALRAVGTALNRWFAFDTKVQSDGSFELPFLAVTGTRYDGGIQVGGRYASLRLQASETPVEITLQSR